MMIVTKICYKYLLTLIANNGFIPDLGLYTNPITPTPDTVLSDLVQPTGTWYSGPGTSPWSVPFINSLNKGQMNAPSFTWVTGDPEPTVTIYGVFWMDNTTLTQLYAVDPFDAPISLAPGHVAIPYQPTFTLVEDA